MKSGDRLNQIEPLIAEMLIKLDETAAKVDKVSEDVAELRVSMKRNSEKLDKHTDILVNQSEPISFLLESQLLAKDNIEQINVRLSEMDVRFNRIDSIMDNNFEEIKSRFIESENTQQEIKLMQQSILTLLKNKN